MRIRWILSACCAALIGGAPAAHAVIWPNTPGGGRTYPQGLSEDFGPRDFGATHDFHQGLDFPDDATARSTEGGEVVAMGAIGTYGGFIRVQGAHAIDYVHIGVALVAVGNIVTQGDPIGSWYSDHIHVELEPNHTNPLLDLFSGLYQSGLPEIKTFDITGEMGKDANAFYLRGEVVIDAYVETRTKDLDIFQMLPNPTISGFPIIFAYHSWALQPGAEFLSVTNKTSPAKDHFYFSFDVSGKAEGTFSITPQAATVRNRWDEKQYTIVIDHTAPTARLWDSDWTDPDKQQIPDGGVTGSDTVVVEAEDTLSGIDKIVVTGVSGTAWSSTDTHNGSASAFKYLLNLAEGAYVATTHDMAGNDTSVNVDIAGVCFFVENEKLIFSHPVTAKARNSAFRGIHYCETHAQCITADGILAGVRAGVRSRTQAAKMGLDAQGTGAKLVRRARFTALQVEVS